MMYSIKSATAARTLSSVFLGASAVALQSKSALAVGSGGLTEANEKLTEYGLPPILFVPPGFKPIVSEYGRGSIKEKMNCHFWRNNAFY